MTNVYVSGTIASWSRKVIGDRVNKASLRKAMRDHADEVEFYLYSTPVSRGGYSTVQDAARAGINQIVVRTDDLRDIIGVITIAPDGVGPHPGKWKWIVS